MSWPLDIELGTPWLLATFAVIAAALFFSVRKRDEPTIVFSSAEIAKEVPKSIWTRLTWLPDALRVLALLALVFALARPQIPGEVKPEEEEGIDIVLAIDTSCSMRAADFEPKDRMSVAKKSIADLIESRKNDRVGLVVFAAEAASWVPLTTDYDLVLELLSEIDVGMLKDGTAIGSAVGVALNRLRKSDAKSKVIILLTDGDNNAGTISPMKAAQLAKHLDVRIYTILIGSGGPVPFPAGRDVFDRPLFKRRNIPINPKLLEAISKETGGRAYVAKDTKELDSRLVEVLDNLERARITQAPSQAPKKELFVFLTIGAMLFVLLELLLRATRLQRFP